MAQRVQSEVGSVTMLVNNAGIMPCRPLLKHTEQEIRRVFEINVMAHFWVCNVKYNIVICIILFIVERKKF